MRPSAPIGKNPEKLRTLMPIVRRQISEQTVTRLATATRARMIRRTIQQSVWLRRCTPVGPGVAMLNPPIPHGPIDFAATIIRGPQSL
jgi:hypothetical protein